MEKVLLDLGLSENQAKIYLGFLRLGKNLASKIALQLGMDKSSTYRTVEELVAKNLLIPTPKKRGTLYEAANPEVLKELVVNKRIDLEIQSSQINTMIESLKKRATVNKLTYIKIEKGIEAVKNAFSESLECKEKIIREKFSSNHPALLEKKYVKFIFDYAKKRIKKGIVMRELNHKKANEVYAPIEHTSKELLKEMRSLPEDIDKETSFRIYDNTVMIVCSDKNNDILTITIKDQFVAELIKSMFDYIWAQGKAYQHYYENR